MSVNKIFTQLHEASVKSVKIMKCPAVTSSVESVLMSIFDYRYQNGFSTHSLIHNFSILINDSIYFIV